jgi:hypothetical protein
MHTEQGKNTNLKVLSASGHKVPKDSLFSLGKALATSQTTVTSLAIGDSSMGDEGVSFFCKGIQEGGGKTQLEAVDFSWKGM